MVELLCVLRREWARLRRGHLAWALFPLLLFLLLGAVYARHQARDLPVAVVDRDGSALSRQLTRALDATPSLAVMESPLSIEDGLDAMRVGRVQGLFEIPSGLEADVKAGRAAAVGLYRNTANLVVGNLLLKDGTAALRTLSLGVAARRQVALGAGSAALERVQPLRLETRSLYNPSSDYEFFLVPGLLGALLFMLALLGGVGAFADERSAGSMPELWRCGGGRLLPVLLGKLLPQLLRQGLLALLVLWVIFPVFGIQPRSPWPLLLGWMLLLQLASLGLAFALGLWLPTALLATEAAVFLSTPAFIFSGYTFPVEAMPALHRAFALLLPSTPFLSGFIALYQKGPAWAGVERALPQLLACLLIGWGLAGWGLLRLRARGDAT